MRVYSLMVKTRSPMVLQPQIKFDDVTYTPIQSLRLVVSWKTRELHVIVKMERIHNCPNPNLMCPY